MFDTETKKARIWIPVVAFIVITIIALILIQPMIGRILDNSQTLENGMTARETVMASLADSGYAFTDELLDALMSIGMSVFAITAFFVYPLAASAIGGLIGLLFCNPIFGVKINFRAVFAVFIYTAIVPALFFLGELIIPDFVMPSLGMKLYDILGMILCGVALFFAVGKTEPKPTVVKAGFAAGISAVAAYGGAFALGRLFVSMSASIAENMGTLTNF